MNLKDLISKISSENNIPAAQVRKITVAVLAQFAENIDQGENFQSPILRIKARTVPEKQVTDEQTGEAKTIPARKVAVMTRAPKDNNKKGEGVAPGLGGKAADPDAAGVEAEAVPSDPGADDPAAQSDVDAMLSQGDFDVVTAPEEVSVDPSVPELDATQPAEDITPASEEIESVPLPTEPEAENAMATSPAEPSSKKKTSRKSRSRR